MSRTSRYKLLYVVTFAAVGTATIVVCVKLGAGLPAFLAIAAILLVPGRIQGYLWRDFFRGRRLLANRRFGDCLPFFQRFLQQVSSRPSLNHAVWLGWSMYTRDIEAMTYNNVGAAQIELGNFLEAGEAFRSALLIDPEYPLPYYNLAVLEEANGNRENAVRCLLEAERLGFRRTNIDEIVRKAGELLARAAAYGVPPASAAMGLMGT